jgi:hypothetical protein
MNLLLPRTQFVFFALLMSTGATCLAETSVHIHSNGACTYNTIVMPGDTSSSSNGKVEELRVKEPRVLAAPQQPCEVNNHGHMALNALEIAQLRIMEWEHRLQVSVSKLTLGYRLGEHTASLWAEISNDSPYDAHDMRSERFGAIQARMKAPLKMDSQVFRKPTDPDVIFSGRDGAPLPGSSHVILLLASAKELLQWADNVPDDYCLYDVSTRAQDQDIDGYTRAWASLPVNEGMHYSYRSVPFAYLVTMKDMFGNTQPLKIPAFLRFAPRATKKIFYPSSNSYSDFQCLPLQ